MKENQYAMTDLTCEILNLGNELLIGKTINTNLTWLGKELSQRGVLVKRATICRDEKQEIVSVIREILQRAPKYLIISGGLGPTFDDIQLECLAEAIKEKLVVNEEALKFVAEFYQQRNYPLTEERKKMALLPESSKALQNPVGAAPGAITIVKNTTIISLPGVPAEMKGIMEHHVLPLIEEESKKRGLKLVEYYFQIKGIPESGLAPVIKKYVKKYPTVGFKSHPLGEEGKPIINMHVYKFDVNAMLVKQVIQEIWNTIHDEFPNAILTKPVAEHQ